MTKENLNEQGRSMVEMLGVLAVIGVLTIIGIAGFKMAINKAKANNLVADMNRLAHIVVMDKFSGYSEEAIQRAVDEHNQSTEYPGEYEYRTTQVFAIKTKNAIGKTLCQQVASLGWKLPLATYLNKVKIEGTFDEKQCTDENELIWAFTNDLSACPDCPLGDFDCTPYANRECGTCDSIEYTPNNADCNGNANGQYCLEGQCVPCGPNHFWQNNVGCTECADSSSYSTGTTYRHSCLTTMFYRTDVNSLNGCFINRDIASTDEKSCKACANRCYLNGACYRAGDNQPHHRQTSTDGECACKNLVDGECLCPPDSFFDHNQCRACSSNGSYAAPPTYRHSCLTTMFYRTDVNSLNGCFINRDIASTDEKSCKACANRCYLNGACYRAGNGYARDGEGNCVSTQ